MGFFGGCAVVLCRSQASREEGSVVRLTQFLAVRNGEVSRNQQLSHFDVYLEEERVDLAGQADELLFDCLADDDFINVRYDGGF